MMAANKAAHKSNPQMIGWGGTTGAGYGRPPAERAPQGAGHNMAGPLGEREPQPLRAKAARKSKGARLRAHGAGGERARRGAKRPKARERRGRGLRGSPLAAHWAA